MALGLSDPTSAATFKAALCVQAARFFDELFMSLQAPFPFDTFHLVHATYASHLNNFAGGFAE